MGNGSSSRITGNKEASSGRATYDGGGGDERLLARGLSMDVDRRGRAVGNETDGALLSRRWCWGSSGSAAKAMDVFRLARGAATGTLAATVTLGAGSACAVAGGDPVGEVINLVDGERAVNCGRRLCWDRGSRALRC